MPCNSYPAATSDNLKKEIHIFVWLSLTMSRAINSSLLFSPHCFTKALACPPSLSSVSQCFPLKLQQLFGFGWCKCSHDALSRRCCKHKAAFNRPLLAFHFGSDWFPLNVTLNPTQNFTGVPKVGMRVRGREMSGKAADVWISSIIQLGSSGRFLLFLLQGIWTTADRFL